VRQPLGEGKHVPVSARWQSGLLERSRSAAWNTRTWSTGLHVLRRNEYERTRRVACAQETQRRRTRKWVRFAALGSGYGAKLDTRCAPHAALKRVRQRCRLPMKTGLKCYTPCGPSSCPRGTGYACRAETGPIRAESGTLLRGFGYRMRRSGFAYWAAGRMDAHFLTGPISSRAVSLMW